ncbi:MAG TPA: DUF885 family protein, partial [Caulobacteraceae bacterium]
MITRRLLTMGAGAAALAAAAAPSWSLAQAATSDEDARLLAFLDAAFQAQAQLSPETLTQLGGKARYGELDDYTPEADARSLALSESQLARMKAEFDPARLSPASRVSYNLFEDTVRRARDRDRWSRHGFMVSSGGAITGGIPVFLINNHRVAEVSDAEAYVSRLNAVERVMNESATELEARAAAGLTPPHFVFEPAINDAREVLNGAPFGMGEDSPVWADFKTKVGALEAADEVKARLLREGEAALTGP